MGALKNSVSGSHLVPILGNIEEQPGATEASVGLLQPVFHQQVGACQCIPSANERTPQNHFRKAEVGGSNPFSGSTS
jgi:hypothetical protein